MVVNWQTLSGFNFIVFMLIYIIYINFFFIIPLITYTFVFIWFHNEHSTFVSCIVVVMVSLFVTNRYPHIENDHLVKLLKQLMLSIATPLHGKFGRNTLNAADVPTLLGTGSFSLLDCKWYFTALWQFVGYEGGCGVETCPVFIWNLSTMGMFYFSIKLLFFIKVFLTSNIVSSYVGNQYIIMM